MRTEALKALFALLEAEDDDFPMLVQRFGIDPATELRNCDLTNVDFGNLATDTLDLTGSHIEGANLSKVQCRRVIGASTDTEPSKSADEDSFDAVLLAISSYQNADWTTNQIVASERNETPVLTFYHSTAEQQLLTKRLCEYYGDASYRRERVNFETLGTKFLWFYSKALKPVPKLNPAFLDAAFFDALRAANTADDIGIYPHRPNYASVQRIKRSVWKGKYEEMRSDFVRSLQEELSKREVPALKDFSGSVVVFSGFPPISKRLFRELRDAIAGRLGLIFLCSSAWEPRYLHNEGAQWRKVAVPAHVVGDAVTVDADIRRLIKRIETASRGSMVIGDRFGKWMEQFVGKPLAILKQGVASELRSAR